MVFEWAVKISDKLVNGINNNYIIINSSLYILIFCFFMLQPGTWKIKRKKEEETSKEKHGEMHRIKSSKGAKEGKKTLFYS